MVYESNENVRFLSGRKVLWLCTPRQETSQWQGETPAQPPPLGLLKPRPVHPVAIVAWRRRSSTWDTFCNKIWHFNGSIHCNTVFGTLSWNAIWMLSCVNLYVMLNHTRNSDTLSLTPSNTYLNTISCSGYPRKSNLP